MQNKTTRQQPQKTTKKPKKPSKLNTRPNRRELARLQKLLEYEELARSQGFLNIAGIDEVGRGPLAGPVVAAACIIPKDVYIVGVNDSKQLTPKERRVIEERILADSSIKVGIGIVDHTEINQINIYHASKKAMCLALESLATSLVPDLLLVDGMKLEYSNIPSWGIIKGDALSQSIAAASIIAKEARDRIMERYHEEWPQYGFASHKGYSTPEHFKALAMHGMCPIHRAYAFRHTLKDGDLNDPEKQEICEDAGMTDN